MSFIWHRLQAALSRKCCCLKLIAQNNILMISLGADLVSFFLDKTVPTLFCIYFGNKISFIHFLYSFTPHEVHLLILCPFKILCLSRHHLFKIWTPCSCCRMVSVPSIHLLQNFAFSFVSLLLKSCHDLGFLLGFFKLFFLFNFEV